MEIIFDALLTFCGHKIHQRKLSTKFIINWLFIKEKFDLESVDFLLDLSSGKDFKQFPSTTCIIKNFSFVALTKLEMT